MDQCIIIEMDESIECWKANELFARAYYEASHDEWILDFPGSLDSYRPKTRDSVKGIMRRKFYKEGKYHDTV